MKKNNRWICLFLVLCQVLAPSQGRAQGVPLSASKEIPGAAFFDPQIPKELGQIQFLHASSRPNAPVLIHLQTAHGNTELQKKLASILSYLNAQYHLDHLFLEGVTGKASPELLQLYPNPAQNHKILEHLIEQGWAKGAELFLAKSPKVTVSGIENVAAYRDHLKSYYEYDQDKEKVQLALKQLDAQIKELASKRLNLALRQFLKDRTRFQNHPLILEHTDWLKKQSLKVLKIDLSKPLSQIDWPMLSRLTALQEIESKWDKAAFEREKGRFLESIKSLLSSKEVYEMIKSILESESSPSLKLQEIDRALSILVSQLPKTFRYQDFPNVNRFMAQKILHRELDTTELHRERERMEDKIMFSLAPLLQEKAFCRLEKDYRLLEQLNQLELNHDQCVLLKTRRLSRMLKRMQSKIKKLRQSSVSFKTFKRHSRRAMQFYLLAERRDQGFIKTLEASLKDQQKSVLITGGFHADSISEMAREMDFNYVLMTPVFEPGRTDQKNYGETLIKSLENSSASKATLESPHLYMTSRTELRKIGVDGNPAGLAALKAAEEILQPQGLSKPEIVSELASGKYFQQFSNHQRQELRAEQKPKKRKNGSHRLGVAGQEAKPRSHAWIWKFGIPLSLGVILVTYLMTRKPYRNWFPFKSPEKLEQRPELRSSPVRHLPALETEKEWFGDPLLSHMPPLLEEDLRDLPLKFLTLFLENHHQNPVLSSTVEEQPVFDFEPVRKSLEEANRLALTHAQPTRKVASDFRSELRNPLSRRNFMRLSSIAGMAAALGLKAAPKIQAQVNLQTPEVVLLRSGEWTVLGAVDNGPRPSNVQIKIGNTVRRFSEIKVNYGKDQIYSVKGNGFLRAVPPGLTFGTSFVTPGYWMLVNVNGVLTPQLVYKMNILSAELKIENGIPVLRNGVLEDDLTDLKNRGILPLEATTFTRIEDFSLDFRSPIEGNVQIAADFTWKALKSFRLSTVHVNNREGLKIGQFSSNYVRTPVGPVYDAVRGVYTNHLGSKMTANLSQHGQLFFANPRPLGDSRIVYLFYTPNQTVPEDPNATTYMRLDESMNPLEFSAQGFGAPSTDPAADNIGFWIHYLRAKINAAYTAGETIGHFRYILGATPITSENQVPKVIETPQRKNQGKIRILNLPEAEKVDVVEASSDLIQWTAIAAVPVTQSGIAETFDVVAAQLEPAEPARFYRVKQYLVRMFPRRSEMRKETTGSYVISLRQRVHLNVPEFGALVSVEENRLTQWERDEIDPPQSEISRITAIVKVKAGQRLKMFRESLGMDANEFGRFLNPKNPLSNSTLLKWEKGTHLVPLNVMKSAKEKVPSAAGQRLKSFWQFSKLSLSDYGKKLCPENPTKAVLLYQWMNKGQLPDIAALKAAQDYFDASSRDRIRFILDYLDIDYVQFARQFFPSGSVSPKTIFNWFTTSHITPEKMTEIENKFPTFALSLFESYRKMIGWSPSAFASQLTYQNGRVEIQQLDYWENLAPAPLELKNQAEQLAKIEAGRLMKKYRQTAHLTLHNFGVELGIEVKDKKDYLSDIEKGLKLAPKGFLESAFALARSKSFERFEMNQKLSGLNFENWLLQLGQSLQKFERWQQDELIPLDILEKSEKLAQYLGREQIKNSIKKSGLSVRQTAFNIGIPPTTLKSILKGDIPLTWEMLQKFGIPQKEILGSKIRNLRQGYGYSSAVFGRIIRPKNPFNAASIELAEQGKGEQVTEIFEAALNWLRSEVRETVVTNYRHHMIPIQIRIVGGNKVYEAVVEEFSPQQASEAGLSRGFEQRVLQSPRFTALLDSAKNQKTARRIFMKPVGGIPKAEGLLPIFAYLAEDQNLEYRLFFEGTRDELRLFREELRITGEKVLGFDPSSLPNFVIESIQNEGLLHQIDRLISKDQPPTVFMASEHWINQMGRGNQLALVKLRRSENQALIFLLTAEQIDQLDFNRLTAYEEKAFMNAHGLALAQELRERSFLTAA